MGAWRLASVGVAVLALALAGVPAASAKDGAQRAPTSDAAYADPSRELGATSPSCRYALDASLRRSCRASGTALHPYPLSSYGLDVRVGFSITDPGKSFLSAVQSLLAGLWMGLLYLVKGVLLLLEWSFSLDLTGQAMPEAKASLARLHGRVFGEPWLLFGISVAGIWGMWRGLVQRRTTETLGGLAATVGLMVVGLVLISDPGGTVGRAAKLANDAGMAVLGAATTGDTQRPREALVVSLGGVFDATVRQPWCALQFGSTDYCGQRAQGGGRLTNADVWLAYPAQSWQRDRLHREVKGDDDGGFDPIGGAKDLLGLTDDRELPQEVKDRVREAPTRVRMQEAGGTFPRAALLGVIAIGVLGAVALYAYLGIRLLLAGALTLLLLLLAPAMLIAPAFGDSGRATFLVWIKRLIGALAAKLIYAVFLAVVLTTSRVFAALDLGWFGTWLLLAAFSWGVFIKRQEIIGFVSAGAPRSDGDSIGRALSQGYYAWQLGRGARSVGRQVLRPPRRAAAGVALWHREGRDARAGAAASLAREQLDDRARDVLAGDEARAREIAARRGAAGREVRALDRRLQGYDEAAAAARAQGAHQPAPSREQQALLKRRAELRAALEAPATRTATEVVRHTDRNRAETGASVTDRDLAAYRQRRLADLRAGLPDDHERHLRAAGIDPSDYASADTDRREELARQARTARFEDERLLAVAEGAGGARGVRDLLDPAELRSRIADERRRTREERRRRGVREGVYRHR